MLLSLVVMIILSRWVGMQMLSWMFSCYFFNCLRDVMWRSRESASVAIRRCTKPCLKSVFSWVLRAGILISQNIRFRFAQTSLQSNVWKKQATRAHILRQAKSSEANHVQQSQTSNSERYKEQATNAKERFGVVVVVGVSAAAGSVPWYRGFGGDKECCQFSQRLWVIRRLAVSPHIHVSSCEFRAMLDTKSCSDSGVVNYILTWGIFTWSHSH